MRCRRLLVLAVGILAAACAPTLGPISSSVQLLVVLDSMDDTLRIIPVDSPNVVHRVFLNTGAFNKHAFAVYGSVAAIGEGRFAIAMDLATPRTLCSTVQLDPSHPISALAFSDNGSVVYAAIAGSDRVPYFSPTTLATCPGGAGSARGVPTGFVSARLTLFIVASNPVSCPPSPAECPDKPSWLNTSVSEPVDSAVPLTLADSIPLSLPGNSQGAVLASDGLIYVINAGNGQSNARLSQVSPVSKAELSVIAGFGTLPQYIATDGDRIFVASATEGLMVYNTRTKLVERDASSAIPLFGTPRGLAADDLGRVYALIAGSCTPGGARGTIRIFGADLVSHQSVNVGRCPVAIAVTDIPSAQYHFDN